MKLQLETLAKEHQATLPNLPTECTTVWPLCRVRRAAVGVLVL